MHPEHQVDDRCKAQGKNKYDKKMLLHQPVPGMVKYVEQVCICPLKMKTEIKYIGQVKDQGKAVYQSKKWNNKPCYRKIKPR